MTGNRKKDFIMARNEMRKQTGDPNWPGKDFSRETEPPGYTWHHKEDGVTMELTPRGLHDNVTHSGGDSLVNKLNNQPQY